MCDTYTGDRIFPFDGTGDYNYPITGDIGEDALPLMTRVEVTWEDAWSEQDDVTIEALEGLKPVTRHNIGYLVRETEDEIILAAGISEKTAKCADMHAQDTLTDRILVPTAAILEMVALVREEE